MVISLYAGGMTARDIGHHLARTVGVEISHDTISRITDEVYPIVYVDAPDRARRASCRPTFDAPPPPPPHTSRDLEKRIPLRLAGGPPHRHGS